MALNLDSIGKKIGPLTKDYDWKDLALYALGVGAGFDDLDYCYEERLKVVPSYAVAAIFDFLAQVAITSGANLAGILHGEHEIVFHRPIPTEGTLSTSGEIVNIFDKGEGKGAIVVAEADTVHSSGDILYTNIFTLFCRLDGGFGGENGPKVPFELPDREPDAVVEGNPTSDQPLLYRLSGDVFALHVDPAFAEASGFEKPIMHGLCTLGYATRAIIESLFPGEPERMSRLKVRFSKTLYPGVPVKTQVWKVGDEKALYRTLNAENDQVVIDHGVVEWVSTDEVEKRRSRTGIRFDDRVAVVTGAGGGLGRTYALELAKRGAKVVVNDLGGSADGLGDGSSRPADAVVDEIVAAGGEAVANYDSVSTPEGGQAIIDAAIEAFGRVDVLINNAGILRDRSLVKQDTESWNAVLDVHLNGAFNVTRPAFLKMKAQGYGRIVMTTSAAGLYGNFGQTNYSAAKLGLVGFMNTVKLEGRKYDVKVNTVAPLAASRLTESVFPEPMLEKVKPEFVSPLVLYLTSERCPVSGHIYNAGAGYFSRAAMLTGPGAMVGDGKAPPAPEEVLEAWKEITAMDDADEYDDAMTALGPMLAAAQGKPQQRKPAKKEAKKDGGGGGGGAAVQAVFDKMPEAFIKDAAAGVDVIFQYSISGEGGGEYSVIVKDGTLTIEKGIHDKPTTTLAISEADFLDLIGGKLDAMAAYTTGKLKIGGDLMKSQLIQKLFRF